MEIKLTREAIEVKHQVLQNRINETYNKLKDISTFVQCESEIKSIELIKEQYEKMYQAILENEEYDKYREVEDFIISKLAQIEKALDKIIYRTSKRFDEVLQNHIKTSRESDEYKKFYKLDKELEKIKLLKTLLKYCSIYFTKAQESRLNTEISTFKFELLIRRQIEQMVYQNGTVHDGNGLSRLMLFDNHAEQEFFCRLLEPMLNKDDNVLKGYTLSQIMRKNRLLNHLIFQKVAEDINQNPERYMGLLEAPIFNPHYCNIANDPFREEIPYLEMKNRPIESKIMLVEESMRNPLKWDFYTRKKANLSLLKAVLEGLISDNNTTIIECVNVYKRFGFECRPIVISEGQEIVKRVYEKTKHIIKPSPKKKEISGKFAKIKFIGYDYAYSIADKPDPFLTHAELIHKLKHICSKTPELDRHRAVLENKMGSINYLMSFETLFLSDMQMIGNRRKSLLYEITKQSNDWARLPLEGMNKFKRPERPPITRTVTYLGFEQYKTVEGYDETALWESYQSDFEEMGITIEEISHDIFSYGNDYFIAISLDDIGDLPIDFRKAEILTEDKMKKANKSEKENEER